MMIISAESPKHGGRRTACGFPRVIRSWRRCFDSPMASVVACAGDGSRHGSVPTALLCLLALVVADSRTQVCGQQTLPAEAAASNPDFDWIAQRISVADLCVGLDLPFQHGKPDLSRAEAEAYVELLNTIPERHFASQTDAAGDARSVLATENVWESAFYRYEAVRRQAWQNGQITLRAAAVGLTDPFGGGSESGGNLSRAALSASARPVNWSLIADMVSHPAEYVGRPVVMYGLYSPSGQVQLETDRPNVFEQRSGRKLQRGLLRNLTDSRDLAIVDAMGYIGPSNQLKSLETWPADQGTTVPVLVKGWFVKLWGQRPLLVTEAVRILTPRPFDELIREFTRPRTPLSEEEKWLYYETLRQMQLTSGVAQSQLASTVLQRRISQLMGEIQDKATADQLLLSRDRNRDVLTDEQYRTRRTRLDRQLGVRLTRHQEYQKAPETFPLFVDLFQNPDQWQGAVVTLSGHVRRVVSWSGDPEMFGGQTLHELWLYTDDSQHHPAVIVTPSLPPDFPVKADVIDRVSVSGCFFKMYVYRAASEHRLAPLILCGRIGWNPTDDQIRSLTREGALPPGSALAVAARRRSETRLSDTAIMLLGFLSVVVMMAIWGRVQRDRRERQRLLAVVDDAVRFDDTALDPILRKYAEL